MSDVRPPQRGDTGSYREAEWAQQHRRSTLWTHRLRVMLGHDMMRVEAHRKRYTQADVAAAWKSYLADSEYAQDEPSATRRPTPRGPGMQSRGRRL